jgi:predicted porin
MGYGQIGTKFKSGKMYGKLAGTVYTFGKMKSAGSFDYTGAAGTNTDNNLGSFNLAGEIGTKIGGGKFALVGEYINNYETNTNEDTAWIAGLKYKIGKFKMKYLYADVDHNAVPDFLPDSDRFGGDTGIKGHEIQVGYAINKRVSVRLDYYATKDSVTKVNQDLLQLDLQVKF